MRSDVEDLIARAQRLADATRPPNGHSLQWCVEAWLVGDIAAIGSASLRGGPAAAPPRAPGS